MFFGIACGDKRPPPTDSTNGSSAVLSKAPVRDETPEPVALPQQCAAQRQRLRDSALAHSRDAVEHEIVVSSVLYVQLRDGGQIPAEQLLACRAVLEPLLAEFIKAWYQEARPGHPREYPKVRDAMRAFLAAFPDSPHRASTSCSLGDILSVLAKDQSSRIYWLEAAEAYGDAAASALIDEEFAGSGSRRLPLRGYARRAQVMALVNAADPYEAIDQHHVNALTALESLLDSPYQAKELYDDLLGERRDVLRAILADDDATSLELLEPIATDPDKHLARLARELAVARLATMPQPTKQEWISRLRAKRMQFDSRARACLKGPQTPSRCGASHRALAWALLP